MGWWQLGLPWYPPTKNTSGLRSRLLLKKSTMSNSQINYSYDLTNSPHPLAMLMLRVIFLPWPLFSHWPYQLLTHLHPTQDPGLSVLVSPPRVDPALFRRGRNLNIWRSRSTGDCHRSSGKKHRNISELCICQRKLRK